MKKILLLVIVAAVVVGAIIASRYAVKKEATKLTFWHIMNYSPPKDVIAAAVKRFEADHPKVIVEVNEIKNDAFKTKIELAFKSDSAPDIFHTWGGGVLKQRLDEGLVLPLDDLFADTEFKNRFPSASLSFANIGNRAACVPVDLSIVPVFYNKKMFAENNLTVPQTFEELVSICEKLRDKGIEPIALGNAEQWPGCFFYVYGAVRAGGRTLGMSVEANLPNAFKNAGFVKAGEMVKMMLDKNCFNMGFQGMKDDAARRLLFTGKAAMTVMGTWMIARAVSEAPEMLDDLGCFPFPAMSDATMGDNKAVVGGTNCAFAVSAKCKNPEMAKELLKYLSDTKFAIEWAATGRMPAVKGAPDTSFSKLTKEAMKVLEEASFVQLYFDQLLPPELGEKHKETVQSLLSGKMTPQQVCDEMEAAAAKIRAR